ncbi:uncharacterized protein EI97DRAFT_435209 [Westerdykella ornata]|uniref:Structure-specific endonuclease subunit SLX4 n=1 Tax=Westerdykella ornata TaxID=318751 RepID=A0A6A6JDW6_WESOR|nr:uncharacterized protein EI97DRAFT_435209 [Westerdykella ornata]KAF2274363.1 hypothetical protein EI97DRAFT_435209 [Westerdykella ornata]
MTKFDIVILSSSPLTSGAGAGAAKPHESPPSSPQRVRMSAYAPLSPQQLQTSPRKPAGALKRGSRAAPVPCGASIGFATAASLLKSKQLTLDDEGELEGIRNAKSSGVSRENGGTANEGPKKPRKRSSKTQSTAGDADRTLKKPGVRKAKADSSGGSTGDYAGALGASCTSRTTASANSITPVCEPTALTLKPAPTKGRTRKTRATDNEKPLSGAPAKSATTTSSYFDDNASLQPLGLLPNIDSVGLSKAAIVVGAKKTRSKKATPTSLETMILAETTNVSGNTAKGRLRAAATKKKTTGSVSSHFPLQVHKKREEHDSRIWDVPGSPSQNNSGIRHQDPLNDNKSHIDEAVARRRDWTPVKDTFDDLSFTDSAAKEPPHPAAPPSAPFTSMLSNFAFAEETQARQPALAKDTPLEGHSRMKRRRVELLDVPGNGPVARDPSPPGKGKAPKKKARTITDLVTGQYAPEDLPTESTDGDGVFGIRTNTASVPLNDALPPGPAGNKAALVGRSSKPSKRGAKKGKPSKSGAKPKMAADKLLSPASALSRLNNQDVLFGTSSQLALEESPTMIRQIQQALSASENDLAPSEYVPDAITRLMFMPQLEKIKGNRRLWTAGARDEDGLLLEEHEPVYMPEPDRTQDIPLLMDGTRDSSFADIDHCLSPMPLATKPKNPPHYHDESNEEAPPTKPTIDDLDAFSDPPPSHQPESSSFLDIDDIIPPQPFAKSKDATIDPPTKLDAPLKKRPSPSLKPASTVLQKHGPSHNIPSTLESRLNSQSRPPITPPKSRGRYAQVEEILDSEDDEALSPTPPRRKPLQEYPSLPLVLNRPAENMEVPLERIYHVATSQLEWANIKPSIFRLITSHIRSIPPTEDPNNPSWYEKMLMYDPIIVEDFTAYLNAHTSIRAHRRATQKQIKAWNKEIKKRGGEALSVEEGGDQVLVVEKELETYMVRAWCEEHSVCCASRDNKGKVGLPKGQY